MVIWLLVVEKGQLLLVIRNGMCHNPQISGVWEDDAVNLTEVKETPGILASRLPMR
ncbi:hypothetical protein J5X98_22965 [Leptothermofonsia sichuanensis E412]|uniref:hypothetical protein n=1 Tax=Leptothermofonsia sichuanensis TaxID=2917832 RepID=UPI001CA70BE6|nr:hypothetical protein [Leptothermofonsia sichuanensis]QZZ20109.1 hypothetical protein J5X98_22965 [Leptothermofonsia sichuanensis E412]